MIQGTGSDVGKSLLVAGIARAFTRRGLAVRPFKPQNMSTNAAVTADGGEIGRAQALQAQACGIDTTVDMNPVLLKPQSDRTSQVVVQGRVAASVDARGYLALKKRLLPAVLDSFARVADGADLVLIEGAGSPAEVNLRDGDIANMGFAAAADIPVILVGDIDRGGVIASLVGTMAVLTADERQRVAGFIVNKLRGDPSLFADGMTAIAQHTGLPALGLVPWFGEAARLPAEDSLDLAQRHRDGGRRGDGRVVVAVPRLPHIANFDDLDPLAAEPGLALVLVEPGRPLPVDAALVLLPGSKSTRADLAFLRAEGWDVDVAAHVRQGGRVLGLCGGYQMLGRAVIDRDGLEGPPGETPGLGLLDVVTTLAPAKTLARRDGRELSTGEAVAGYEIHLGQTSGPDCSRPMLDLAGRPDGAVSADGRIAGCYLHGLFATDRFRAAYLAGLGATAGGTAYGAGVERALDALADHLERAIDLDAVLAIARRRGQRIEATASAASSAA
ncbi:MAG: cobyric acid synthase [Alphaproteobacteria bacterium]|nr:cobyric acid synthase [Alphaproteobacteria bacterium]